MNEIGLVGFSISTILSILLLVWMLGSWQGQLDKALLIVAVLMSVIWSGINAYFIADAAEAVDFNLSLQIVELLKNVAWIVFIAQLAFHAYKNNLKQFVTSRYLGLFLISILVMIFLMTVFSAFYASEDHSKNIYFYFPFVCFSLLILSGSILVVDLFRSASPENYSALKFFGFGVGCLFIYDALMYTQVFLFGFIDPVWWQSRGLISSISIVLVSIPILKNCEWSTDIHLSHKIVFNSVTFGLIAAYVFLVILSAYLIGLSDSSRSEIFQLVFIFVAAMVLLILVLSVRLRAVLKIVIAKHFFNYKYDYRDEWQRFIRTLSKGGAGIHLLERATQAVAQIVESPSAKLWLRNESGYFDCVAHWEMPDVEGKQVAPDDPLVEFLEQWQWVIDFHEYKVDQVLYRDLCVPKWMLDIPQSWVVVPMMQDVRLLGFVLLTKSSGHADFNWEDRDLLKTAGRQAATHIAQLMATQALIDAREFQAFSRLSAFVIHDLKNLVGQLTMVVQNSEKFKGNPDFMEDAIGTVDNCVGKMNGLLRQLRTSRTDPEAKAALSIGELLIDVSEKRKVDFPVPSIDEMQADLKVHADKERLSSVIEHMVQNAQESCKKDGFVKLSCHVENGEGVIVIKDNGCGMSAEFIQHRLFKPFDTTKGSEGMGIGAFQCRDYVRSIGGDVEVSSYIDEGSVFKIKLPVL